MSRTAPGFADPPLDAQRHFRTLLAAIAEPGRPQALLAPLPAPPGRLHPAAWALLLTLVDLETPLWLDPALDPAGDAAASLRFHSSCPLPALPTAASFALLPEPNAALPLTRFPRGTPDYPDLGATLLIQVDDQAGGTAVRLAGPGIEAPFETRLPGIGPALLAALAADRADYPLGLDLVLVGLASVIGLPRSTRLEPC